MPRTALPLPRPNHVAVVAHAGKTFGGGRRELRKVLAAAGHATPLWYEVLPSFYVEPHLRSGKLRAVLTDYVPKPLFVHAVYQRSKHLSPKVRALIELLRERFRKADWAVG